MKTILLGKITKINGFEGAVTVRTDRNYTGKIPRIKSVFLEIDGRPVPFFIEYLEINADSSLRMKFEDYDSYEKVKEFAGLNVLLPAESTEHDTTAQKGDLLGFSLLSEDGQLIGTTIEIITNPGQLLLRVKDKTGKELLIPLHEDLVVSVDTEKQEIIMIIPEGLIELNK